MIHLLCNSDVSAFNMPTTKKRINVTISRSMDKVLENVATRDRLPVATKAAQLLELALEIEEDQVWDKIASARDKKNASFVSHHAAWL